MTDGPDGNRVGRGDHLVVTEAVVVEHQAVVVDEKANPEFSVPVA